MSVLDLALVDAAARAWLEGSVHAEGRSGNGQDTRTAFAPKSADDLLRDAGVTFDGPTRKLFCEYERAIRQRAREIAHEPEPLTIQGGTSP